jgi:tryptophan-rich sensory protein
MADALSLTIPPRSLPGLAASVLVGAIAAATVSVGLVVLLPGGTGSIDETLPATGPLGALISDIVPFVWVGLFAGLGAAYWLVAAGQNRPGSAGFAVLGLIGLCMVYPVVASGTANPVWAILGNGLTVLAALLTAGLCWSRARLAALFPALVAVWVSLATAGLLALAPGLPF